jgi:hypothetical protein
MAANNMNELERSIAMHLYAGKLTDKEVEA